MGRCTINNRSIQSLRKDPVYQAAMLDLATLGVIDAKKLHAVIPGALPHGLTLDGCNLDNVLAADEQADTVSLLKKTEED